MYLTFSSSDSWWNSCPIANCLLTRSSEIPFQPCPDGSAHCQRRINKSGRVYLNIKETLLPDCVNQLLSESVASVGVVKVGQVDRFQIRPRQVRLCRLDVGVG